MFFRQLATCVRAFNYNVMLPAVKTRPPAVCSVFGAPSRFYADDSADKIVNIEPIATTTETKPAENEVPLIVPTPKIIRKSHQDRDKRYHRQGVQPVSEGIVGEKAHEFADLSTATFPTLETMKELFDGVPYERLPKIYLKCSKNNTKMSVCDYQGMRYFLTTCGTEGFKNCKKKTEVAGQTVGVAAGAKCIRQGLKTVRVIVEGLGPGRLASVQGLTMSGVNVISITENTRLNELGPRPRKRRRL